MSPLGHSRPTHSVPVPTDVRYGSDSDHSRHESEWTLSAISVLRTAGKQRAFSPSDHHKPDIRD
jgi:hypothetical protein